MSLKDTLDRADSFMGGHQIVNARTYKRKIPNWVFNDKKVREIITRGFPSMLTNENQKEGAARWASVIHLYFRMGYTRSQIAEEIGSTSLKIHNVIRSIRRVSNGQRSNGTGKITGNRGKRTSCSTLTGRVETSSGPLE